MDAATPPQQEAGTYLGHIGALEVAAVKKWTKKFLEKRPIGSASPQMVKRNGRGAEKQIKFPAKLWMRLSKKAEKEGWKWEPALTAFAAGMAVGWAEHEKSVK